MNIDAVNDKLRDFFYACENHQIHKKSCALWVLYAVERYIRTGRSSLEFDKKFCETDSTHFEEIIDKCLSARDLSDDGIIKKFKRCIGYSESRRRSYL